MEHRIWERAAMRQEDLLSHRVGKAPGGERRGSTRAGVLVCLLMATRVSMFATDCLRSLELSLRSESWSLLGLSNLAQKVYSTWTLFSLLQPVPSDARRGGPRAEGQEESREGEEEAEALAADDPG